MKQNISLLGLEMEKQDTDQTSERMYAMMTNMIKHDVYLLTRPSADGIPDQGIDV